MIKKLEDNFKENSLNEDSRRNNPLCREYDSSLKSRDSKAGKRISEWGLLFNQVGMYGTFLIDGLRTVFGYSKKKEDYFNY